MTEDIVVRLRRRGSLCGEKPNHVFRRVLHERWEAADEIERLRAALQEKEDAHE
ncbi:hypothetical protein RPALISO_222 [Ruegeria phage RpAliso]|nr:hypothetical protein RPALISO_222 [Ruegeria phage RpAliso]